jgi:polyisoprenoid-binding protein YceI
MGVMARGDSRPSKFCSVQAAAFLFLLLSVSSNAPAARAQETVVHFDPAQTKVEFSVESTLHTVHGTFRLKSGEVRFDPATGKASGAIVVNAASGDSANDGRNKRMHERVLESSKFAEIVFTPTEVQGRIAPKGRSEVEVSGVFRLHGQDHNLTMTIAVEPNAGKQIQAATHFEVPYVRWGLKSASSFILNVKDTVDVEIHAVGELAPGAN